LFPNSENLSAVQIRTPHRFASHFRPEIELRLAMRTLDDNRHVLPRAESAGDLRLSGWFKEPLDRRASLPWKLSLSGEESDKRQNQIVFGFSLNCPLSFQNQSPNSQHLNFLETIPLILNLGGLRANGVYEFAQV
jgi:hypothetical protein